MRKITLTTDDGLPCAKPSEIQGLTCRHVKETVKDYGEVEYDSYTYPELGCARTMVEKGPPVLEILGRRWMVIVELDNDGDGIPEGGDVTFVEVGEDTPLTKWEPHDPSQSRKTYWFGQPTFIQNPVFPHNGSGQSAYPLLTIESGWGDCGNENILVAFDPEGTPIGVFHEYSCC